MSLTSELLELSQHLQQEHLFVTTEREQLQRLYHNVTILSERLFHTAWIARQQKQNLQHFIDQGNNVGENIEVYSTNNQLEEINFIDSYKVFSYHDSKYGELLRFLYENPQLLANMINVAEKVGGLNVQRIIGLTVTSIFGNCIFKEDERVVLHMLKTLLVCQLVGSEDPRRLIRRQNLSFSLVYKHLCETLFSARLFLTATLYEPIMRLLMEDEWFFDIDPDKALVRFPPGEKVRRFGEPGTEEYITKQAQYRSYIVDKLVILAVKFINSIKANMHCFPASLGWLVSQVYRVLTEQGQVSMQEVRICCADLVFALFICPAICDPEPHGITSDVPISHIARHNLMQMAQIIQVLAISQFEEIDPKVRDLYSRFEKGCMTSVLDIFLEGPWEDVTEQHSTDRQKASIGAARSAVLLTSRDVREMIGFLRNAHAHLDDSTPNKKTLHQLLSALPADMPPSAADNLYIPGGVVTPSPPNTTSSTNQTPETPGTPNSERKLFKTKGYKKKRSTTNSPQLEEVLIESIENENKAKSPSDVLVISIYPPGECLGMLPEKKVLSSVEDSEAKKVSSNSVQPSDAAAVATPQVAPNPEVQEKRTRFSLSHDQESIGNASDYQEVVSEAASSHSVEDENELETDNFSDMMSANVSGRGSPSISGRDTPLSQAGSVEENPPAPQLPVPVPETVRKENRVDVTERFGKFEIKAELAMERDECKSTVSDTWSTDVLASDSEPPEQNQVDRLEEVAEEIVRPLLLGSEPISEISETASDAWSTDVLASDTEEKHSELLKDLEQDFISGGLDRDEGDSSLGHDEIDENALDLDHLGAVGGNCQLSSQNLLEANDSFTDPFVEMSGKLIDDSERTGNGKKISSIVHHFQSGPNLQLPSIHRLPSTSLKHAEGRVTSVAGALEGNTPTGSATTPTSNVIPPSTGARNKVREKKKEREGRLSIGGGDEGISEFDPMTSGAGAGGRRKSKDRWTWSKNNKTGSDHSKQSPADDQDLPTPGPATTSNDFPTPPTSGHGGHHSSRDSGIDIWVNTNGQMSGSSSRSSSTALLNARSSLDSMAQRHAAPLVPGRSSLDSNLQRLHSSGGRSIPRMPATVDSGIHSSYLSSMPSSSLDTNTPPLEMDNPLFRLMESESVLNPQNRSDRKELIFNATSNQQIETISVIPNSEESLIMLDSEASNETGYSDPSGDKYSNRKLRRSTPQIEVTDMFKKISVVEGEQTDIQTPNNGEQRVSNVNERRLSSALTLFDPFASETDSTSIDLITSNELIKDLSFDGTDAKFANQETHLLDNSSSLFSKKSEEDLAINEGQKSDQGQKGHHRQDSSGSSQSASSLKLNTTYETPSKQQTVEISDDKDLADGDKNRKISSVGFLRSMKDKFHKGIKRKNNNKTDKDMDTPDGDSNRVPKPSSQGPSSKDGPTVTSADDDILAKYRTPKKTTQNKNITNISIITNNNTSSYNNNTSKSEYTEVTAVGSSSIATTSANSARNSIIDSHPFVEDGGPPFFDRDNLEGCAAFQDAKRKLRLVLSMADISFGLNQIHSSSPREGASTQANELMNILNAQLAEAINLQNKDLVAQLYEVIRCMKLFNADGCKRLIQSMKEDYCNRSPYISYLVRCRQRLLSTRNQLQRLLSRVTRDKEICSKHLINMCARQFLERREKIMWKFISEFQKLSMSDEKTDLVEQFLQSLYHEMSTDSLWKAANTTQIEDGQQAIERFLMSRIYTHAMFPNGDGDIMRDQLLQDHLKKLSKVITPSHKDLRIPSMYHLECPWPAAQKEIFMINAYRTPKDKIRCVHRCSQTIMNLLSMANEKSVPAADDFMPVLIFVLIKANPFGLLSTIQYVNSFYEKRLQGEEQYWWLQLTSAVEFIKTMDYST